MLAPGTAVQRYVVEASLGAGGMGAVYRARDTHLDRPVALKLLSDGHGGLPDGEARERLVREARAAAALSHPNAVAIYDAGDSEHGPFIVMELVEGETLREAMQRAATADEVLGWMKMAALALGEAHERGIVHRDVKPENIMIRRDGIAKVLDFGIARQGAKPQEPAAPTHAALPSLTGTGVQLGTPSYMAPEQIKGKPLDGRTDQFAWAVTAFEALAGRSPWSAEKNSLGLVAAILEEVPPDLATLRPDVPAHVGAAIAKALRKDPDQRFATMRDLVRALEGRATVDSGGDAPKRASVRPPLHPAPTAAPTMFSEATVKAVIGKALSFEDRGGYSRDELRDAARELGIDEAAIEGAARAIREDRERQRGDAAVQALRDRVVRARRRAFVNHLIAYVGVNLIFLVPALVKDLHEKIFVLLIPALGWGIGLAIHATRALSSHVEDEELRRERAREERAAAREAAHHAAIAHHLERRGRRERIKKEAADLGVAVEDGVASVLSLAAKKIREGSDRAQRIDVPPEAPRVRVGAPVSTGAARAEAEAEAEAAEQARRRDRRVRR